MKNDISQSPIITVILASHKRLSEELVVLDNAGAPVAAAKLSEVCDALEREIEVQALGSLDRAEGLQLNALSLSDAASSSRNPLA